MTITRMIESPEKGWLRLGEAALKTRFRAASYQYDERRGMKSTSPRYFFG
jgi:hypothetical protein